MEAVGSSETTVHVFLATRHQIPARNILPRVELIDTLNVTPCHQMDAVAISTVGRPLFLVGVTSGHRAEQLDQ
jgi:hypothetical protein